MWNIWQRLTGTAARRRGRVHPGILEYLDELASKCANVLFDLVYIVLRDALIFRLALFNGDISSYQISHDTLISKVSLGSLLDFSLRQENQKSKPFSKFSLQSAHYDTLYIVCPRLSSYMHYLSKFDLLLVKMPSVISYCRYFYYKRYRILILCRVKNIIFWKEDSSYKIKNIERIKSFLYIILCFRKNLLWILLEKLLYLQSFIVWKVTDLRYFC